MSPQTKALQWAIDSFISRRPARKFICLSCAIQRHQPIAPSRRPLSTSIPRLSTRLSSQSDRSSLRSSTAINAVKDVRPAVRQLYDALAELKDKAPVYVNLSRLQLALSSLESGEHAKIRIAGMGLGLHSAQA